MLKYDWDGESIQEQPTVTAIETAGFGALRIALLFGSAAVALAIILVPLINRATGGDAMLQARSRGVDTFITGSTTKHKNEYSVRRSVLQDDVTQPCIIYADGRQTGGC